VKYHSLGNLCHDVLRRDQTPVLVSDDIGKMGEGLRGSTHEFGFTSGDLNETCNGCPRVCGLLSMKAAARLILGL
jgi:hypothetical protein